MNLGTHTETGARWADAFVEAGGAGTLPKNMRPRAGAICRAFAGAATARAGTAPCDWDTDDVKAGLWAGTLPLPLPVSSRARIPGLCANFLRWAGQNRNLAQGAALAEWAQRLAAPYRRAVRPPETLRPRSDGRRRPNEPCACGSGRKHKRCCGASL